jgi:hypothetical protein
MKRREVSVVNLVYPAACRMASLAASTDRAISSRVLPVTIT